MSANNSDFQILIGDYSTTLDYNRDWLEYSKNTDTHKNCRNLINNCFVNNKWVDSFDWPNKKKAVPGSQNITVGKRD